MKLATLFVLFASWTLIHAQDRVYCVEEFPDGRPGACPAIELPVCAFVQVECITQPCAAVPSTRPNGCDACANPRVDYYIPGECSNNEEDVGQGSGGLSEEEEIYGEEGTYEEGGIYEGEQEACFGEEEFCWPWWEADQTDGGDDNGNPVVEGDDDVLLV